MSEIIKCPICHKMAGIRYDINRVYQSRCQNMECRETVTVTAPSEAVAEELFSQFEKGTNQPQLTIPKIVADIIDGYRKYDLTADRLIMMAYRDYQEFNDWIIKDWVKNDNIARAYLAGKSLGVDLVKVVEG